MSDSRTGAYILPKRRPPVDPNMRPLPATVEDCPEDDENEVVGLSETIDPPDATEPSEPTTTAAEESTSEETTSEESGRSSPSEISSVPNDPLSSAPALSSSSRSPTGTTQGTLGTPSNPSSSSTDSQSPQLDRASPLPQQRFSTGMPFVPREHRYHHNGHHRIYHQSDATRHSGPGSAIAAPDPPRHFSPPNFRSPRTVFPPTQASSSYEFTNPAMSGLGSAQSDIISPGHRRPPSSLRSWDSWDAERVAPTGHPTPWQRPSVPHFASPEQMLSNGHNGHPQGWSSPTVVHGFPGGGMNHFSSPPPPHPAALPPFPGPMPQLPPFQAVMQLPESLDPPMNGYKLLTMKLGGSLFGTGPHVTPIYRRFQAMGHRRLLQLQDELCLLEEELNGIDRIDSEARRIPPDIFMPASARAASLDPGPIGQQRLEILARIHEKLDTYYKLLKSFSDIQCLPWPSLNEVNAYKQFLHNGSIVEEETRFLDATEDHLVLASTEPSLQELPASGQAYKRDSQTSTPTPESASRCASPAPPVPAHVEERSAEIVVRRGPRQRVLRHARPHLPTYVAYGVLVAVLVPVMTFTFITEFVDRLVIVALVFAGVATAVIQAGILEDRSAGRRSALYAGVYGCLMTVVAWIGN